MYAHLSPRRVWSWYSALNICLHTYIILKCTYLHTIKSLHMHTCIYAYIYIRIHIYVYKHIHIFPHNLCAVDIGLFQHIFCTHKRICTQTNVYIKYTPCLTTRVLVCGYLDIGLFWPCIQVSLDEFPAYTNVYALFWRFFFWHILPDDDWACKTQQHK